MHEPLISVIIPTFSRDKHVGVAARSVLNQTYRNLELIVVDDGSQVPARKILGNISDSRLKIIRHENNMGVSAARNTGIAQSNGEWIALLDDDDLWRPQKLLRQLTFTKNSGCPASVTDFTLVGTQVLFKRRNSKSDMAWMIVTGCGLNMSSSMLARRDVFNEIGKFDPNITRTEDWDWLLRYHQRGHKMAIVPEPLTIYTGIHRSSYGVEAESIRRIKVKYTPVFSAATCEKGAFNAAIGWKEARVELSARHYASGLFKLALTGIKHPIHFSRYMSVIFQEPMRRLLSKRHEQLKVDPPSANIFVLHHN